jgi:hypothetical protein
MIGQIIGHREFVDGTRRPTYLDPQGQYVLDDEAERVYGVYLIPEESCCDLPVIVDEAAHDRTLGRGSTATPLAFIHELWRDHQHACPYLRHDEQGCYCTSPGLRAQADRYMVCDHASLQIWCLTEDHYTKCCLWPAGDVP